MTDLVVIVAIGGLVVTMLLLVVSGILRANAMMIEVEKSKAILDRLIPRQVDSAQQVIEKLMCDPAWAANLHARERIETARLKTSLEREAIRQQAPPAPTAAPPEDVDGIPTDNAEEARYQ